MKTIIAVAAALLGTASVASGADLAAKARPYAAPAPVFSWTGCSVGAHAGYGWGRQAINRAGIPDFANALTTASGNMDTTGGLVGAQAACDYQFSGFVVGIQGSFSGTNIDGTVIDPLDRPSDDVLQSKINYIWSVTGRLGFTVTPETLVYVRGGWAGARMTLNYTQADAGDFASVYVTNPNGWTLGGGVEWALWSNWTVFAEYNHYAFGRVNLPSVFIPPNPGFLASARDTVDVAKFGLNYRFNFGGPLVAKY